MQISEKYWIFKFIDFVGETEQGIQNIRIIEILFEDLVEIFAHKNFVHELFDEDLFFFV